MYMIGHRFTEFLKAAMMGKVGYGRIGANPSISAQSLQQLERTAATRVMYISVELKSCVGDLLVLYRVVLAKFFDG